MITLSSRAGTIDEHAQRMVKLANQEQEKVETNFNGVRLVAEIGDDPNDIVKWYHKLLEI